MRRRVLILTHSLDRARGSGRFASGVVDHLRAGGQYDVRVLTTLAAGSSRAEPLLSSHPLRLILNLLAIRRAIKNADIVHALDLFPYGCIAALARIGLKKKLIITAVGSGTLRPLCHPLWSPIAAWALRTADARIAHGAYIVRQVHKILPALTFQIIPPGIDYDYFAHAFEHVGHPHERPYILSVAKVKSRKGVEMSLRAFAAIATEFPELDYINVGIFRGPYVAHIEALVEELGIKERVLFKQRIPDEELIALYRYAELFILLPQNEGNDVEGFGLVYVEAAAFGLPVIGALESGAEDAIGDNGYLVAPKNAATAAARMAEILRNPILRAELSQRSIAFAKSLDWKNIITRYSALYE